MKKDELKKLIRETSHEIDREEYIEFTKETIKKMGHHLDELKKMMIEDGFDYDSKGK